MAESTQQDPQADGWNYNGYPKDGDSQKLVTLKDRHYHWIAIRTWDNKSRYWMHNGEPERTLVLAWRDLPEVAKGFWSYGKLYLVEERAAE